MSEMQELMTAGAHFGHLRRFWNPKMARYLYETEHEISIINLEHTIAALNEARTFVRELVANGSKVLFVGTKPASSEIISAQAQRAFMPYVSYRWLGGTLTNWKTIRANIKRLEFLTQEVKDSVQITKKEKLMKERMIRNLRQDLDGISNMNGAPDALFVVDVNFEHLAVSEARKMGIKVVGLVDTNANPEVCDISIPMNDDSKRAIQIAVGIIADACLEGGSEEQAVAEDQRKQTEGYNINRK